MLNLFFLLNAVHIIGSGLYWLLKVVAISPHLDSFRFWYKYQSLLIRVLAVESLGLSLSLSLLRFLTFETWYHSRNPRDFMPRQHHHQSGIIPCPMSPPVWHPCPVLPPAHHRPVWHRH